MSDIRKAFEEKCLSLWHIGIGKSETFNRYDDNTTQFAWTVYQAGRAHDIGGLIAEIEKLTNLDDTISLHNLKIAIHKHFGKE